MCQERWQSDKSLNEVAKRNIRRMHMLHETLFLGDYFSSLHACLEHELKYFHTQVFFAIQILAFLGTGEMQNIFLLYLLFCRSLADEEG